MGSNPQPAVTGNDGYLFRLPETEPRGRSRPRRIPQVLALWFAGSFSALSRELKQAEINCTWRLVARFAVSVRRKYANQKSKIHPDFPEFVRAYFGSIRPHCLASLSELVFR